ncbi:MAG: HAD hydrolase-like protein [Clostridia bacterium]|nr:HAD hydrolase-like protein [Clostridia bacterium]MBR2908632.1 HAD hydrolase-like protein [Clostridia bacterium]
MRDRFFLFDLDGTLTDSREGVINSVMLVLTHYGIEIPDDEGMNRFIGPPLRVSFRACGIPENEIENAMRLYRERYFSVGKYECRIYPGVESLLARLYAEGYPLYVATSKPEVVSVEILEHFGLARYFGRIAGATLDGSLDTKEAVIERLFEEIDAQHPRKNAVMIGDTVFDALGARSHGIPCVGVAWGYGIRSELLSAGVLAIAESTEALYGILTRD